MTIKSLIVLFILTVFFIGCSVKLSPKAADLTFISDSNKHKYDCRVIDAIESQATGGFNIPQRSMAYFKNQAVEKDANAYRIIFSHYNWSTSILIGEALICHQK